MNRRLSPNRCLDSIVVEDSQGDGCFPNSAWTDESDGCKVFCEIDDSPNQLVASETGPRWRGRQFSKGMLRERKTVDPMVFETTDLA
jgi:hypothetical protein